MKNICLLFLIIAGCSQKQYKSRDILILDGEWNFKIDSLDKGITDHWHLSDFEESVHLPGSMAENGKGKNVTLSTDWTGEIVDKSWYTEEKYARYRQEDNIKIPFWLKPVKYYKGPAWYQKVVNLPEQWKDKRIILHLERCHWESTVFVNNHMAGTENSLATPHEYDITPFVQPGKNRIAIRIDNRMIIPVGVNSHSVSDHTQTNWNGITGQIYLKAVAPVHIREVQIYPNIHTKNARAVITLVNQMGNPFDGNLELHAESFNSEVTHITGKKIQKISFSGSEARIEAEVSMGEDVQLWSEFTSSLYHMHIKVSDLQNEIADQKTIDFGMREFRPEGTRFRVNGHPVFLRGTLECCIFPLTGYPPTDVESWEFIIKRCKEHGLNHMRFHSWCPPEAAFMAADKLGFYLQIECSSWANQGSTIGDGSPVDTFIYDEGDRILKFYGNHPSFCMMAYGNEPAGENQAKYLGELLNYWKMKDNRRVYTSGAGWPLIPENDFHNAPQPRIQQWGAGLTSIINAEPPQTVYDYGEIISSYDVPYVSHEIGQWCVYPDFNEMPKYSGVLKPTNFEIFRETLSENHMGDQAGDFLMASGKLQTLCYKAEIEAALRTPGFAGFQLLQLHDFPGQGTALVGVLDPFFGSKDYVSPGEFRQFSNQTVPLARMGKRVYTNDDSFTAEIEIAHFGEKPIEKPEVLCQIFNSAHEIIHKKEFILDEIGIDNAIPVGSVTFPLSRFNKAEKLSLKVSVNDGSFSNRWDFWVYPKYVLTETEGKVHITKTLDENVENVLKKGGSVLLMAHGQIARNKGADVQIGFSSIFWNTAWTNSQAPHTLGILCNPEHPVFNDFPTEYHSNWQWWDPVTNSQVMILDGFPPDLRPLIQPIDTWFENRRLALAWEAKIGEGRLLVCSIDLESNLENRHVSRQLRNSILKYMMSDSFNPENQIELSMIRELFNP